ncbi:HD domain-containing protein [Elusimicrobiota bacterium]
MLTKKFIETIYSAASIQRWNDHVRPVAGFSELDKQAHKMIIAYVLAKMEETQNRNEINWINLIEGGLFEFLHRVTLTDLKPDVFHELMEKKGSQLNNWVLQELDDDLESLKGNFKSNFEKYLNDPSYAEAEKRILKAAHYLATKWEFNIIYNVNSMICGIEKRKEEINNEIKKYSDLAGVKSLLKNEKYYGFIDLCGQLGFQQRWAQQHMQPKTSVLGHMLIVAILSYVCLMDKNYCEKRMYNNFYSALLHDLPEVLTRDIISPIKTSISGLDSIIKDYERRQINEKILPLLPEEWHDEIKYFILNEFKNRVIENSSVVEKKEINESYNKNEFSPVDGEFIEAADKFAAYVEACLSIDSGIKSKHLVDAKENLLSKYKNREALGFKFGEIFEYFK